MMDKHHYMMESYDMLGFHHCVNNLKEYQSIRTTYYANPNTFFSYSIEVREPSNDQMMMMMVIDECNEVDDQDVDDAEQDEDVDGVGLTCLGDWWETWLDGLASSI